MQPVKNRIRTLLVTWKQRLGHSRLTLKIQSKIQFIKLKNNIIFNLTVFILINVPALNPPKFFYEQRRKANIN